MLANGIIGCCSSDIQNHNACWHSCAVTEEEAEALGTCVLKVLDLDELSWLCNAPLRSWNDPAIWGGGKSGLEGMPANYAGGYTELRPDFCVSFEWLDDDYPSSSESQFRDTRKLQCGIQYDHKAPLVQMSGGTLPIHPPYVNIADDD